MSELHEQEIEFSRLLKQAPLDDAPRGEHRDALRERVMAAFDSAATNPAERRVGALVALRWTANRGRNLMRRPLARFMVVGAACLAIAAVWLLAPGRQSTAQAFAMFAEAIVGARSARFQMDVAIEGQPKRTFKTLYLAPGKYRHEMPDTVSIWNVEAAKSVVLMPTQKRAMIMNMKNMPRGPGKMKDYDTFERMRYLLSESRDSKEDQYERLGEKEVDGRRAVGFRYNSALAMVTMWGDPATGMPVRVETVWSGIPRTEATMTHFELNPDLKPSLFDTTPPADYKVQSFDADLSKATETDLIGALRITSGSNDGQFIDGLDTASINKLIVKLAISHSKDKDKEKEFTPELMKLSMTIGRGIMFALELPETADAHYAGKGVKRDESDRPVFWYKPAGSKSYRVIYADLSVKETDEAPDVEGAVRVDKVQPKPAVPEQ